MEKSLLEKIKRIVGKLNTISKSPLARLVAFIASIITLIVFFWPTMSNKTVDKQSEERDNMLLADVSKVSNGIENIETNLESIKKTDCSILEKNWVSQSENFIDGYSFKLSESDSQGTATFSKDLSKFYNIVIKLSPKVETSLNTTISIKDGDKNELSITIGDQDNKSGRIAYKQEGIKREMDNFGRKNITPEIDTKKEITIIISIGWFGEDMKVSSHLNYTPEGKDGETLLPLLNTQLPNDFIIDPSSLNIGIRNSDGTNREIKVLECSISKEDEILEVFN